VRGVNEEADGMFSYTTAGERVPAEHPLRRVKQIAVELLKGMSRDFSRMYSRVGRPSIPPEKLLRALLLQGLHSIRSERLLMEELNYNLLFRWFVGLLPKDGGSGGAGPEGSGRDEDVDYRGEKRSNATHASTTDPDARLYKKSKGGEARLCYMGHVLMENRNGLVVDARLTIASGTAEQEAAVEMVQAVPGSHRITVGMDKAYDQSKCVQGMRGLNATAHVAQKKKGSVIDERTVRHAGYQISMRVRKRVEEIFGWVKTVGVHRKTRFRGELRVGQGFLLTLAAYDLVRIGKLTAQLPPT